jgi:hypothetical protein
VSLVQLNFEILVFGYIMGESQKLPTPLAAFGLSKINNPNT